MMIVQGLVALLAVADSSAGEHRPSPYNVPAVASVSVTPSRTTLTAGKTVQLIAVPRPLH